jgi:hypothetical protein
MRALPFSFFPVSAIRNRQRDFRVTAKNNLDTFPRFL